MHAWYSKKQHETIKMNENQKPYKIYINKQGKEVYATCVSNTLEHGCNFDDMVYLGEVEKYSHSE
jgi:hypothetical protein